VGRPTPPPSFNRGYLPRFSPHKSPQPPRSFRALPLLGPKGSKGRHRERWGFPQGTGGGGRGGKPQPPPRPVARVLGAGPHGPLSPPRSFRELPLLGPKGSKAGREGWGFPQGTEGGGVGSPNPLRAKGTCSGALQAPNPQGPFGCYPYLVQRAKRQAGKDGWGLFQGPASP
jgi:hypothetical protein